MLIALLMAASSMNSMAPLHGVFTTLVTGAQLVLRTQRHTALKNAAKALTKFQEAAESSALKDDRGMVFKKRVEAYEDKLQNNKMKYLRYREVLYGGGSLATFLTMLHVGLPVSPDYIAEWGYLSLAAAGGMTGVDALVLNPRQIQKVQDIEHRIQERMKELLGDISTNKFDMTFNNKQ